MFRTSSWAFSWTISMFEFRICQKNKLQYLLFITWLRLCCTMYYTWKTSFIVTIYFWKKYPYMPCITVGAKHLQELVMDALVFRPANASPLHGVAKRCYCWNYFKKLNYYLLSNFHSRDSVPSRSLLLPYLWNGEKGGDIITFPRFIEKIGCLVRLRRECA